MTRAEKNANEYLNWIGRDRVKLAHAQHAVRIAVEQTRRDLLADASDWIEKHISSYINSEYNEFHHCVEYDGTVNKAKMIEDFLNAMKNKEVE